MRPGTCSIAFKNETVDGMVGLSSIDIIFEQWRIASDNLCLHMHSHELCVFGSRAKGKAKPYSDLDLAVLGDDPMSIEEMARLNEAFEESALPFKVDVVDWALVAPSFRKAIENDLVVIDF